MADLVDQRRGPPSGSAHAVPTVAEPGTPEYLRDRLIVALDAQVRRIKPYENYINGDHPRPAPPKSMQADVWEAAREAFLSLAKISTLNITPVIANAPAKRLNIHGFRFGEQRTGDDVAWAVWQHNHLDAAARDLHETALQVGNAYTSVWPGERYPEIRCEHPSEVVVAYDPGSRWVSRAALKRWEDEDGRTFVNLYTADALYKWRSRTPRPGYSPTNGYGKDLVEREVAGETWPLRNPLGRVPIVEFPVHPGLRARPYGGGRSEIHDIIPGQDRMNKTTFDRLVISEHQSFLQRFAIGWTPPVDPATGEPDPRAMFQASQSRLWTLPGRRSPTDQDVQIGELRQADFTAHLKAVQEEAAFAAVISSTPPSYFPLDMKNLGAETIAQVNAGFIDRTKAIEVGFTERWEETLRLAMLAMGDRRADDPASMVMWDDIEVHTLGEKVDAAVKLKGILPVEEVLARLPGATDTDVKRWMAQIQADALRTRGVDALAGLLSPDEADPTVQPPPG